MNKVYFARKVAEYQPHIEGLVGDHLARMLNLLVRDVERDARQKATELAFTLQRDIQNMQYED